METLASSSSGRMRQDKPSTSSSQTWQDQPLTSLQSAETFDSKAYDRSVNIQDVYRKLHMIVDHDVLTDSDIQLLRICREKISAMVTGRKINKRAVTLPPETTVICKAGKAYATETISANQFVAEYPGVPVFRIKDESEDDKFIVFRKTKEEPFFEQLTSDKCVSWSSICCHGIEFGIDNSDGLGVNISHSKKECNVEIQTSYAPEYEDPKDGTMHDVLGLAGIQKMAAFLKFMDTAVMSVVAIKRVKEFGKLCMDYAPDCQSYNLEKNWVSSVSERAKDIIKQKIKLHDEYAQVEGVESYWKPRTDLSPVMNDFKMRWKDFLKDKSSLEMEQVKTFYEACDENNQQLLKGFAQFIGAGHTTNLAMKSVADVANTNDENALAFLLGMQYFLLSGERAVNVSNQEWLELNALPADSVSTLKRSYPASTSEEASAQDAKKAR